MEALNQGGGRMPTVILVVGVGLLTAAVAAAVTAAALLRREWDELDDAFAEARGGGLDPEMGAAPWSSFDLAVLHDGVSAIDQHDPFATLVRANAPVSWHATAPNGSGTNGSGPKPVDMKPIVWRAPRLAATRR